MNEHRAGQLPDQDKTQALLIATSIHAFNTPISLKSKLKQQSRASTRTATGRRQQLVQSLPCLPAFGGSVLLETRLFRTSNKRDI